MGHGGVCVCPEEFWERSQGHRTFSVWASGNEFRDFRYPPAHDPNSRPSLMLSTLHVNVNV